MRAVFRTDSSQEIGTGHVMRCLTLADGLALTGVECHFICREHPGNIIERIHDKGYRVHTLAYDRESKAIRNTAPLHSHWLGGTQDEDAQHCIGIIKQLSIDWIIVDHYALDVCWEQPLSPWCNKMMVIDDLADRKHNCDLLLDQTFGRNATHYQSLVPKRCKILCGSPYSLIRPEFALLRSYSLRRRKNAHSSNILISMGGIDKDNVTGKILSVLNTCILPNDCKITVVMGSKAPWLAEVYQQSSKMLYMTTIRVDVSDMARLMADCDLAIGAAGGTSWERCCLGVPTIMLILAENQRSIAEGLNSIGAACLLDEPEMLREHPLLFCHQSSSEMLLRMSAAAAAVTDGTGVNNVISELLEA